MKPPTKFELMRNNRELRELRIADAAFRADDNHLSMVKASIATSFIPAPVNWTPAPPGEMPQHYVAPSMDIDGVRYVEAPGNTATCGGCALKTTYHKDTVCRDVKKAAAKAFGSHCEGRPVIYIKAA